MSIEKEMISFILSWSKIRGYGGLAAHFKTLGEATANANLEAEFIFVMAYSDSEFQDELKVNPIKYPLQVVAVGERNTWDQEMFAGLSRANGDYVLVVGDSLVGIETLLPSMLNLARIEKNDVVGIRSNISYLDKIRYLRTEMFFRLLRRRTKAPLTIRNCSDLLITRKALNWILRDLSSALCMVEMYLIPGLTFDFIKTETIRTKYKLSHKMYLRLLTRYTLIPLTTLKSCFSLTALVMLVTAINALSVRWRELNLLNQIERQVPGWTTLVLLLSFGFTVTIYSLYVLLRTVLYLAEEYSSKPNHVIKSVQRP